MKKNYLLTLLVILFTGKIFAQDNSTGNRVFSVSDPFEQKVFIENNEGQFNYMLEEKDLSVLYSARIEGVYLLFTPQGIVYRYDEFPKLTEEQREKIEHAKANKTDLDVPKVKTHFFSVTWKNAGSATPVEPQSEESFYYTYPKKNDQTITARAFRKLVYRNIYPNIDVEYYFPEEKKGIEYNIVVHPGGDLSQVKLEYKDAGKIKLNQQGDLEMKSTFGKFVDHAPFNTYYSETSEQISCAFVLDKNTKELSYNAGNYDRSKTLIVDPWTTNPGFTGYNSAYDVNYDVQGNVYIFGSYNPFQLSKYNSAGTLQWSYNATQFNSTGSLLQSPCYGGFAVDFNTGRSYLGEGFNSNGARLLKISSAGALLATFAGNSNFNEIWRVRYNRCLASGNQIILAAGTSTGANQAAVIDTSLVTLSPQNVLGATQPYHDMVGIAIDNTNGYCYMATAATTGSETGFDNKLLALPVPALVPSAYMVSDGYAFSEVGSVNYVDGAVGATNAMNCMAASPNWLYMYDGKKLTRFNKASGANISTTNVGASAYSWGGIDVDQCDHLYLGNNTNINMLDSSYNSLGSIPAAGQVYDVKLGLNGELYACGKGFVSSYSVSVSNVTLSTTQTPATCTSCNGTATVKVNTCGHIVPAANFSYLWSNGQTGATAGGLCPGTYTVTVSSNCYQVYTTTVTVTSNSGTFSVTSNNASYCPGGSATLSATATGAVSYTWTPSTGLSSTNSATVTANPTVTTVYTVSATNASGCIAVSTSTVTVNATPTVTVNSTTICAGSATTLTASGATTYTWSPGTGLSSTTGASVNANPASTTVYTVTGANGTCSSTATSTITVNTVPAVTVNSATICPGGSVTLNASGATNYSWSPGTGLSATTGASVNANPASTTVYTITGTTGSCSNTATSTVTIGPALSITVNSATLCTGGSATLNASGATNYSWSPGTGLSSTTGTSVNANPASTTIYTVTGSTGSCSGTATSTVTINTSPTVTVNSASICAGSSATLNAGGAATYSWTPSTGLSSTTGASVSANPVTTTVYSVTGTSAGGCVSTVTSTVTVNPMPTVTVNSATVCPNATVTLTANGASTYSWNTGATTASITESPSATTNYTVTGTTVGGCVNTATTSITVVSNLSITVNNATICSGNSATLNASGAATYSWSPATGLSSTTGASVTANPTTTTVYTITGTAGTCSAVTTATVTVNSGGAITVNTGTVCIGSSTTLNANGASTYTWSPAATLSSPNGASVTANPAVTTNYTVTGTDINGCVYTNTTTVDVNPLPSITANNATVCNGSSATLTANGAVTYTWAPSSSLSSSTGSSVVASPSSTTQYTITGTDANGCANTDTTTVTVASSAVVNVNSATICTGGSVTLTASGASTYTWTPATGLSSATGSSVTASPATTTVYTINASAGTCTATGTSTVTVVSNPSVTVNSAAICSGSSTTLNASGATTYTWSPSSSLSSSTGSSVTANPASTTVYTINATLGTCTATGTTTVTVNSLPNISANPGFICNAGSTTLNANGASTYTWSPSGSLSSSTGASVTASPTTTTQYTITGTDANGCVNSGNTSVTVVTNPTISINAASICLGQQTATLTAFGASTFNWSPASGLSSTTGNSVMANPSSTTVYTITGTIGSCTATATTTVTVNPLPAATASGNSPVCVNNTLNLNSGGGVSYSWSGPSAFSSVQQNPVINGVTNSAGGDYTVTVTDANSCYNTAVVSVTINPLPVVSATGGTVCTGSTANLIANNSGVTYSWSGPNNYSSNQQNTVIPNADTTMNGNYIVTVTDANGCVNGNFAQLTVNSPPTVTASSATICAVGSAALTASGANTYTWSPATGLNTTNGANVTSSVNATTNYTVTGSDANGCTNTALATVNVNPLPTVAATPLNASGCVPLCVDFSSITTSPGSCSWTFGDGSAGTTGNIPRHCFTRPGAFSVVLTFTDGNGCSNTASSTINVYPQPHAAFYSSPQPTSILEPTIHFTNNSNGAVITAWNWSFGNAQNSSSTAQNPVFTYSDAGSYPVQLIVTSDNGCKDSVTQVIVIEEEYALYVPNAFSPNDDGSNDIFTPKGEGISDYKLFVFDRWGNQVFFSNDLTKGWDGRFQSRGSEIVQEDVYVWKIELKNQKGRQQSLSGTVSLLK